MRLKGCRYLKSEIVRWLINGSLGAKLRACALMKAVKEKKEVRNAGLFEYQAGNGFTVSAGETNRLIADDWILLDASSYNGRGAQFVLGREFDFDAKGFYKAARAFGKAIRHEQVITA